MCTDFDLVDDTTLEAHISDVPTSPEAEQPLSVLRSGRTRTIQQTQVESSSDDDEGVEDEDEITRMFPVVHSSIPNH